MFRPGQQGGSGGQSKQWPIIHETVMEADTLIGADEMFKSDNKWILYNVSLSFPWLCKLSHGNGSKDERKKKSLSEECFANNILKFATNFTLTR